MTGAGTTDSATGALGRSLPPQEAYATTGAVINTRPRYGRETWSQLHKSTTKDKRRMWQLEPVLRHDLGRRQSPFGKTKNNSTPLNGSKLSRTWAESASRANGVADAFGHVVTGWAATGARVVTGHVSHSQSAVPDQRSKTPRGLQERRTRACASRSTQRQIGLDRHVHGGNVERLEHDLRHALSVGPDSS